MELTDDTIRDLTPAQRSQLIARLAHVGTAVPAGRPTPAARRRFLTLLSVATLVLVPWIVVLAVTLPHRYIASHWTLAWVGFDVALLVSLARTAWFGWRRRQAVVPAALLSAALLVCDAWFDVTTATPGSDLAISAASAVLLELPLAVLLVVSAHHLMRATLHQLAPHLAALPLTRVPLFGADHPRHDDPYTDDRESPHA